MYIKTIRLVLMSMAIAAPLWAQDVTLRDDLNAVFEAQSTTGTFVLYQPHAAQITVVNAERAETAFIPASTFKIINSLIALETGVVADETEIVPHGEGPQFLKVWEQEMSIRDGIAVSHVPLFQELARRIGTERYEDYLGRYGFGNAAVGDVVDMFWLKGPLKISAMEWSQHAARLAVQEFPADTAHQLVVRDIIRLEDQDGAVLYGKTGWTTAPDPDIGWFVGWVEQEGKVHAFALNIDMQSKEDAPKRIALTKAFLAAFDVY